MQISTQAPGPANGQARITALLGPTNTGKTHFAMERMLAHPTGMIGFPLRLLARENYDRAVAKKGAAPVALITGEEKIIPEGARYFFCTVESMPLDRDVAFLAIDEIQMCADAERGHIFTERLLHARGTDETMFLGADTITTLLRALVPGADIMSRPRLSTLTHTGARKLVRLPPRSAVVAFSATNVYAIAEQIRRHAGGAAVVMGALSPRTRNAQVAMYQAGEVDYLVATDAIGMGLNMDVDHVALAATRKFDGRMARTLAAPELAQIAGRAGRHMNDGTFGTTGDIGALDDDVAARIETHDFDQLKTLNWRNPALDFSSQDALLRSFSRKPEERALRRAREAMDETMLKTLLEDPAIRAAATTPQALRLLWDVAQVPDFRGVMGDAHARLLARIYGHLNRDGRLPTDWVASRVADLDRTQGAIETIMTRLAGIRTWTYVAFQSGWVDDAAHWRDMTRRAEDALSDRLHESLMQRFVDRRAAHLVKSLRKGDTLMASVSNDGTVMVEGHALGTLTGFRFTIDTEGGHTEKAVTDAAMKVLRGEVERRIAELDGAPDTAFRLNAGAIAWNGVDIAKLAKGADAFHPTVEVMASDLLDGAGKERVRVRLARWLDAHINDVLKPLLDAEKADLPGPARGLLFQMKEGLGDVRRRHVREAIDALDRPDRKALREVGVRIGRECIHIPALLKAAPMRLRGELWATFHEKNIAPLPEGRVRLELDGKTPNAFYEAQGFRPIKTIALRIDMLERIASRAFAMMKADEKGVIWDATELMSLAGTGPDLLPEILWHIGYEAKTRPAADRPQPAPKETKAETAPEPQTDEAAPAQVEGTTTPQPEGTEAAGAAEAEAPTGTDTATPAETEAPAPLDTPAEVAELAAADVDATITVYVRRQRQKPQPRKDAASQPRRADGKNRKPGKSKGTGKPGGGQKPNKPGSKKSGPKRKEAAYDPDSPFAKLKDLLPG